MRCAFSLALLVFAAAAPAAEFGTPGGPLPANLDEVAGILREDPYDLELLIGFGTSKGGSAGHLEISAFSPLPTDLQSTTQSFGCRPGSANPAASMAASIFARKTLASA